MNATAEIKVKQSVSLKWQCVAAVMAVAVAVALPQLCHLIGEATGLGKAIGVALLPMHLPVLFVGLAAGPLAGGAAGLLSPLVSMLLSGMPVPDRLPLMMAELCAYGLAAGLLKRTPLPCLLKLLIAQLAGRAVYMLATVLAIYAFSRTDLGVLAALQSFKSGLWGIVLQCALLPPLVLLAQRKQY